jgi:hypothetical protein
MHQHMKTQTQIHTHTHTISFIHSPDIQLKEAQEMHQHMKTQTQIHTHTHYFIYSSARYPIKGGTRNAPSN